MFLAVLWVRRRRWWWHRYTWRVYGIVVFFFEMRGEWVAWVIMAMAGACMQLIVFFITSKFTSDFPCGAESKFPYENCM